MKTEPLFAEPPTAQRPLSQLYQHNPRFQRTATAVPRWTVVRLKRPIPCDECFALQHETPGGGGPRADAKHRRALPGAVLALCSAHARLWRERDEP